MMIYRPFSESTNQDGFRDARKYGVYICVLTWNEVSAEAVVVPKHSPLTPLVEVDLRIPYEPYRCHSLLHLFKYLDIEDDLLINLNSNNFRFKWL